MNSSEEEEAMVKRECAHCETTFTVDRAKAERYEAEAESPQWACFEHGGEELE